MEAEVRLSDGTVIDEKRDVTIVDTANPFGNLAEIDIEDDSGNLFEQFPFGTRVEIFVRPLLTDFEVENEDDLTIDSTEIVTVEETETRKQRVITNAGIFENQGIVQTVADDPRPAFSQRFTGYVVERNDQNETSGRDNLQLTVYSFDQLLRADSVSNDQTGNTITEALEDIIKEDTAVTWNANKVDVEDDQTLTESFQGAKVEDALLKLSQKSVDERFGVDDSVEFFFSEQEPVAAPNDITDADWIDYQLPERGEESKNETRTFYDNGDRVTVVEDGVEQLELQESLGTDDPVALADDRARDDLTDTQDAEEDAEQNLKDKETVKVYEFVAEAEDFLTASPGEVFDVTIESAGIDGEFRIAELEYQDLGSTVRITAIRNKGNTDDVLRRITERLRRKELENANIDAPQDRILQIETAAEIANTATVDGITWDRARVTNEFRNQIRGGWSGEGNVNVAEIAVGDNSADLARTNTTLQNELGRTSVTETLNGSVGVDYDASFTETGIQEIGLFDGSGNLLYRAVNDTAESPGTVTIELTVNDVSETEKVVITDSGRETLRDIIADNNPNLPANYAFGSDQTTPTASDTSLGNSLFTADLSEFLIQEDTTQTDLENLVGSIAADKPLTVANGEIVTTQTCWTTETNDTNGIISSGSTNFEVNQADNSSNEDWIEFETIASGSDEVGVFWSFTPQHDIDSSNFEVHLRSWNPDVANPQQDIELSIRGDDLSRTTLETQPQTFTAVNAWEWETIDDSSTQWNFNGTLTAGNEYDVILSLTGSENDVQPRFDVIAPADNRYPYTLDNTVEDQSTDPYLDGPETKPDLVEKLFNEKATTRRELDFAKAVVDINNTSNQQYIELSNDGGSTFIRTNNNNTATANFGSASQEVQSRVGLSRFGSRTLETPRTGFKSQAINEWRLFANPRAIVPDGIGIALAQGLIPSGEIVGNNIRELGLLDDSNTTLTHSITAELSVETGMRVLSAESLLITQP